MNNSNIDNTQRRTPILWILAILTMINTGFSAITYLMWALIPDTMSQSMEVVKESGFFSSEQAEQILSIYTSISNWQYVLLALVQVMLFAGALIMLAKLNPIGFHIYTIGQILQFCVMNFVIGGMVAMDWNAIIMAILWVLMYSTQLRYMKGAADESSNNEIEKGE